MLVLRGPDLPRNTFVEGGYIMFSRSYVMKKFKSISKNDVQGLNTIDWSCGGGDCMEACGTECSLSCDSSCENVCRDDCTIGCGDYCAEVCGLECEHSCVQYAQV
jgi:hypothetical protein